MSTLYIVFAILIAVILVVVLQHTGVLDRALKITNASSANIVAGSALYGGALTSITAPNLGSKKALLFGLNYNGLVSQLYGCITDVQNVRSFLMTKGFSVSVYTDNTPTRPTKANMLSLMSAFFRSLRAGDTAFVWYSGHGTTVGTNEALVPLDYPTQGFILNNTIHAMLAGIPSGARVFMGSDSCYSGSLLVLKYDVEPNGTISSANARSKTQKKEIVDVPHTRTVERLVPTADPAPMSEEDVRAVVSMVQNYQLYDVKVPAVNSTVVYISGCRDNQTSADAYINGQAQGAMTWSFLSAIKSSPATFTLGLLQDLMRAKLQGLYTQVPQLSFGSPISPFTNMRMFGLV